MRSRIEIDDMKLRSHIDHNTMKTAVIAELNDRIVRDVSHAVIDKIIVEFFNCYRPEDIRDIIRMCMEDKEIQAKITAMRTRDRIL